MQKFSLRHYGITVSVLLILNLFLFFRANSWPIRWQQSEITFTDFFWSQETPEVYTLHSGFNRNDFLKLLVAPQVIDWHLRLRHFSYFIHMASLKLLQLGEIASFRDFSLIFLHLLNVCLLSFLIFRLTSQKSAAFLGAVILLNSGTALSTLLFPFMPAKVLIMTLFLGGWLLVASSAKKFSEQNGRFIFLFFAILYLAFFTDEFVFLLFPLVFYYIILKDGYKSLMEKKIIYRAVLLAVVLAVSLLVLLKAMADLGYPASFEMHKKQLLTSLSYLKNPFVYSDTLRAFLYFLRHNFGYWDVSFLGVSSFLAFLFLVILSLRSARPAPFLRRLVLAIVFCMVVKAVFVPHFFGHHRFVMPPDARFPSLLFFSWYYVYPEAVFFAFLPALILKERMQNERQWVLILGLVTIMNFSNVYHLKNGPPDALAFHSWDDPYKRKAAEDILAIKKVLNLEKKVYLSFPSGDKQLSQIKRMEPFELYLQIIPVMYIRAFEQGRCFMSLKNVLTGDTASDDGLSQADLFYDVVDRQIYDLAGMRSRAATEGFTSKMFRQPLSEEKTFDGQNPFNITFFLKGRARISLVLNGQEIQIGKENLYGQSYKLFHFSFQPTTISSTAVQLKIDPEEGPVYLIGPFFL